MRDRYAKLFFYNSSVKNSFMCLQMYNTVKLMRLDIFEVQIQIQTGMNEAWLRED